MPNSDEHFAINSAKVEEEKKFDGIFVPRTNTDLNPLEAMLCYKHLWIVEQTFRTPSICPRPARSSTSSTRPSGHPRTRVLQLSRARAQ